MMKNHERKIKSEKKFKELAQNLYTLSADYENNVNGETIILNYILFPSDN